MPVAKSCWCCEPFLLFKPIELSWLLWLRINHQVFLWVCELSDKLQELPFLCKLATVSSYCLPPVTSNCFSCPVRGNILTYCLVSRSMVLTMLTQSRAAKRSYYFSPHVLKTPYTPHRIFFFFFLNCALVQGLAKSFCKGPDSMYLSLGELNDVLVFYAEQ